MSSSKDHHSGTASRRARGDAALGLRIRKLRIKLGLSQEALGVRVGRSEGWVYQVEKGDTGPGYFDLVNLAQTLNVSPMRFFDVDDDRRMSHAVARSDAPAWQSRANDPLGPGIMDTDTRAAGNEPDEWLEAMRRRAFLQAMASMSGATAAVWRLPLGMLTAMLDDLDPPGGRAWDDPADPSTVEAATEVIPRYRLLDSAVASIDLLGSVQAHLQLTLQLRRSAQTTWARQRLAAAASEAASFAAWLHLDLDDLASTRQHYRVAIEIANRSQMPVLAGYQLGSLASVVTESGDTTEALALLRAAERQFSQPPSAVATAWLWSLRAGAHATAGESAPTQRALDVAHRAMEEVQDPPMWPWLTPFTAGKLAATRGVCEARLGNHVPAMDALNTALASSTITTRRQGELLAELAGVHGRCREPVPTCQALNRALTIAIDHRSPHLLARVRTVRSQLHPTWRNLHELAEFDERLHTTWL